MNKKPQKTLAYYENLGAQLLRPQTLSDYEKLGESLIPKQPQNILSPVASGRRQNNIAEGFISGAKAQGSGFLGGLASWAGGENAVTNYLDEVMRDNQRDREFDGYSWDYFTDPSGFAYDLGGLLGSQGAMAAVTLPLMAIPGVNAGVAGAASALPRLLASRAVTNKAAQYGLENALKKGIQASTVSSPLVKYGITSAPVEAFSEGGQAIKRATQEGYENPYMQGLEVAAKNMPVLLAGNALEMGLLGRGFAGLKGVAGESIGKRAAKGIPHIAGYGAAQGLLQSGEEVMQERAQESTFGDPTGGFLPSSWTEDEKQAFQATFAPGAFMGMLGAVPGAVRTRQNKNSNDAANNNTNNSFDTNLFDKWESRPGATDLDNVRPEIKGALNNIAQELGNGGKITITGGAEKGYHASGEFGHEVGWKVDIDKNSINDPQKFFALCEKYGIAVGDEGDHYDLSAHKEGSTGGKRVATPSTFLSDMVNDGENVTAGKREGHENAWAIYDVFREAGYNDNAIAGILGRVQQEHNFDTSNVEEYDDAETGLHLGGYGMFQWNGGRTTAFLNWAKENNLDPQNARVQAQYALLEARQRGLTPEKMNSLSDEDAATLWTDEWEVGKHGDERKYAKEWAERIAKGGNINSQNNISANNNVDTLLIDGAETAHDNSALMKQLNDIMAEGEIGLSYDQRMALINMATEQKQIPLPNATPQEEEAYYREIDDAINNGDYKTIARMFPQQTARILGINPINTSTPKIDALKQAQEEKTQPQPQIDTQPLAQTQEQQQQPIEQNAVPLTSQNIAGDIENIISQIRSGTFNTGAELNANQQAVLDLLSQPAQNVIETPTQDGLSAGLTAAQKVAQANAAIANFRANEEARAQEEQPAPTVRKYHFDGTQQAQEQAEEAAPIATQDEIIPQEQAETQNRRQLKPMREMYDNAKNVFKNFRDASDAIIAGYEGGYVGRDEAEEMLRQGHSDLRGNLTTKKNANAYNKLLDASIARLNNTKPMQPQVTETSDATETSTANRVNDIREYYNERKEEYRTFELDELEARRKRYIKERVDHYNKNPGGQGTTSVLLDENGKQLGTEGAGYDAVRRETVSNNPEWYQRAYALLGRKPTKKDYEYIAETDLSEWQPAEVQADWQALNEVIEEKKNEEQIKAEPKNVQKFRKDVNQKVRKFKEKLKTTKNKEVSRDNYLAKIKEMHDNALRVATQDETRAAMEEAYNNAVGEINRVYDDVTSQNNETTSQQETPTVASNVANSTDETSQDTVETSQNAAQAETVQNNNVASEATTEKPQTKKAANEGGQENTGEASNTTSKAKEVGDDMTVEENISNGAKAIDEIMQTHGEIRGAMERPETGKIDFIWGREGTDKKKHKDGFGISKILSKHGQEAVKMIPEVIAKGKAYKKYNDRIHFDYNDYTAVVKLNFDGQKRSWLVTNFEKYENKKNPNGTKDYARSAPTADSTDSTVGEGLISSSTIPQTEPTSKDKNSTKQDTKQKERSQNEDAFSNALENINASYSDKSGVCKGTLKNGVITIWRKDMKKGEWNFTVSADEINKIMYGSDNPYDNKKTFKSFEGKRISGGNANINYLWHTIAKAKVHDTNENWIEGSKTDKLKRTRRQHYEESGGKDAIGTQNLAESAARVMRNLYEQTQGARLNQDTRGIYDTANNIVTLTENADESTFIHEMGHHYYNVLKQAAEISGKGSQAAKDVDTIDNWANYKKGMAAEYEDTASEKEFADLEKEITEAEEKGDTKKADELKARWRQERFARGFEEYLSEGIAPTAKLKKIFDNFKKWLKEIYRGLRGAGAKPSDDVRAVMERMIASDKEILSGKASRLTGNTKAAYDKALADLKAVGVKNAEANAYIAAKMAERLSSAYKEAGEDRSAVSLLPEIQAQEKSAQNEKETVRKKYEGTKEWLKAPNGEDTNLTEDQWLTVRTSSFKKWFGDWENDPKNASKVVDENGEPLVVYHGTNSNFNTFTTTKGTYFFSKSADYAEAMAEERNGDIRYDVFLNIRQPLEIRLPENKFSDPAAESSYIKKAKLQKNDGVMFINISSDEIFAETFYVAFESNQIKSATDNNGEFNENDPSILHQKPAKSPIDNNGEMKDNVVNDYLTIKANGSFAVKLLNEKPPLRTESEKERIHRRKEEVSNMDRLLNVKENPDAYAELLSDHTVEQIKKEVERIGSWEKATKIFNTRYNKVLSNYSEIHSEENVIGGLLNLKGAIRYAEQQGNIAGRNRHLTGHLANNRGNVQQMGRSSDGASEKLNTETAKH